MVVENVHAHVYMNIYNVHNVCYVYITSMYTLYVLYMYMYTTSCIHVCTWASWEHQTCTLHVVQLRSCIHVRTPYMYMT